MSQPRIRPGGRAETGVLIAALARLAGRAMGTEPPNLFTTLGRHRTLSWAWLVFAGKLMPGGRLPRRESELVILRVAHLHESLYELEHHTRLGRRAGLDEAALDRVAAGPQARGWSERERAILAATDALVERGELDDELWEALSAHLDERRLIELCMLVGHYEMLAKTIAALRIQPDRPRLAGPPR